MVVGAEDRGQASIKWVSIVLLAEPCSLPVLIFLVWAVLGCLTDRVNL